MERSGPTPSLETSIRVFPVFRWPSRELKFYNLKRLQQGGVTIAAGTDAGNIGTLHGPALHRELERMAEAGLSPPEILTAATQGGARVMGRASELGTIEAGKCATVTVSCKL
ncbi:MAG: amidohydrolase family protein [Gammaproteobacteria bacterium]